MKLKGLLLLTLGLFTTIEAFAQIEITEEKSEQKEKKIKEVRPEPVETSSTEVFLIANWSSTNRELKENEGLFSEPLGTRANEVKLNTWSFGIGIRDRVGEYFSWEGGITYFRNGESYLFEDTDTMFAYQTTYSYIGMPVKALFTYGNSFRLFAGGGIIPQMFLKYRQDQQWENSVNATGEETIKSRSGYNSFVLSVVANVGFQMLMGQHVSVLFMPEYRYQLTSSYEKTDGYKHYARAIGFNVGLTYRL